MNPSMLKFISISNLITYLSLFFSVAAIYFATQKNIDLLIVMISLAVICDLFDGKFANLFSRTSDEKKFGGEIDSLVDALAFGFTPCLAFSLIVSFHPITFIFATFYLVAIVTRLAYYNIFQKDEHRYFIGVPSPIIGLFWAFAAPWINHYWTLNLVYIFFGSLMIAPIRINRLKPITLTIISLCIFAIILFRMYKMFH